MKKFFGEHPFLAVFFTSCMTLIILGFFGTLLFILVVSKSIGSFSQKNIEHDPTTNISYKTIEGNEKSSNKFLSIPVQGLILTSENDFDSFSFLSYGYTYGYSIKNQLIQAASNESIKGIILEIDSPGGTIPGSKAIYDGVKYYRNITNKPVVAHISGMGASGAYLAALPSNEITADYGSLTGSIGVIMGPFKYYDTVISEGGILDSVTTQNGIESFYLTAGTDKDFGNPYERLSQNARNTLQTDLDNEYNKFVDMVANNREIEKDRIVSEIGALVYDNNQSSYFGLIDGEFNRHEAYGRLADLAGIPKSDFKVISQRSLDLWSAFFGMLAPQTNTVAENCFLCGEMLYIYGTPESYGVTFFQK